jgi:hypothetical protein
MSNRLEHEFPVARWQTAVPRGLDHDLVRSAMMRGRHLQGAAIRHGAGLALSAVVRALAGFIRYGASGIAKRAPGQACDGTARRGA